MATSAPSSRQVGPSQAAVPHGSGGASSGSGSSSGPSHNNSHNTNMSRSPPSPSPLTLAAGGAQGGPFAPNGPAPMQTSTPRSSSHPAPSHQQHQQQPSSSFQPSEPQSFAHPSGIPTTVPPHMSHPFSVPPVPRYPPPPPSPSPGSAGDSPTSTASSMTNGGQAGGLVPQPYRREPTLIQSVADINDIYQMNEKLGSGYTAVVFDAVCRRTNQQHAIKCIHKTRQKLVANESYFRDIYDFIVRRGHPNLVKIREVLEDPEHFYIVMEKCKGPDLVEFVLSFEPGGIPEADCKRIMKNILAAVRHLHEHRLLHRDIKLDNVIFQDRPRNGGQVVLLDFDMCMFIDRADSPKTVEKEGEISVVGTREYMAPECYKGQYTQASDLWGCGVILYVLIDGHFPFDVSNCKSNREVRRVLRQGVKFEDAVVQRFPAATDLVSRLLTYYPNDRLSSAQEALDHPWFGPSFLGRPYPLTMPTMSPHQAMSQPAAPGQQQGSANSPSHMHNPTGGPLLPMPPMTPTGSSPVHNPFAHVSPNASPSPLTPRAQSLELPHDGHPVHPHRQPALTVEVGNHASNQSQGSSPTPQPSPTHQQQRHNTSGSDSAEGLISPNAISRLDQAIRHTVDVDLGGEGLVSMGLVGMGHEGGDDGRAMDMDGADGRSFTDAHSNLGAGTAEFMSAVPSHSTGPADVTNFNSAPHIWGQQARGLVSPTLGHGSMTVGSSGSAPFGSSHVATLPLPPAPQPLSPGITQLGPHIQGNGSGGILSAWEDSRPQTITALQMTGAAGQQQQDSFALPPSSLSLMDEGQGASGAGRGQGQDASSGSTGTGGAKLVPIGRSRQAGGGGAGPQANPNQDALAGGQGQDAGDASQHRHSHQVVDTTDHPASPDGSSRFFPLGPHPPVAPLEEPVVFEEEMEFSPDHTHPPRTHQDDATMTNAQQHQPQQHQGGCDRLFGLQQMFGLMTGGAERTAPPPHNTGPITAAMRGWGIGIDGMGFAMQAGDTREIERGAGGWGGDRRRSATSDEAPAHGGGRSGGQARQSPWLSLCGVPRPNQNHPFEELHEYNPSAGPSASYIQQHLQQHHQQHQHQQQSTILLPPFLNNDTNTDHPSPSLNAPATFHHGGPSSSPNSPPHPTPAYAEDKTNRHPSAPVTPPGRSGRRGGLGPIGFSFPRWTAGRTTPPPAQSVSTQDGQSPNSQHTSGPTSSAQPRGATTQGQRDRRQ
mmetsp:Transcript_51646/g.129708  ORF Transcript_51646/g.129708 Transcript_51646/m.129708 type:complete len:1216 (-) Transcript_51646:451-4098(-)